MVSGDYALASSGSNRTLTVSSGKTAVATVTIGGTPDLHIAFTDGAANVIWVTDETTNQPITLGNTLTFPGPVYTSNQPT